MEPQGSDSLRAVIDSVFADPVYDWAERPALLGWLARVWDWLTQSMRDLRDANPELYRVFVVFLIIALGIIVLHTFWVFLQTARRASAPEEAGESIRSAAPRTAAWYRDQAEEFAEAGQYREAMLAAFHALVLDLDRQGVVTYHPSKTPAEYARDRRLAPGDRSRFDRLVTTLYGCAFGPERCGLEEFHHWQAQAGERWHAVSA